MATIMDLLIGMITSMRNIIYALILFSIVQMVSAYTFTYIPKRKMDDSKRYALLIGGGFTNGNNFESYYNNIEYVTNALKKLGYCDDDIKILFYGGKTPCHPIVEGTATKENFIAELHRFENTIDSNDSLLIFRSGHGMSELVYENYQNYDHGVRVEGMKYVKTISVMKFLDGDLNHLEFQEILENITAKQIVVILNQCFAGQFADIAMKLNNTVVITETRESEIAINDLRWKHKEWAFVKCFFDGFLQNDIKGEKQSIFNALQYMLKCNPNIEGIPIKADRPLLKENPRIEYGSGLKRGSVYIY